MKKKQFSTQNIVYFQVSLLSLTKQAKEWWELEKAKWLVKTGIVVPFNGLM